MTDPNLTDSVNHQISINCNDDPMAASIRVQSSDMPSQPAVSQTGNYQRLTYVIDSTTNQESHSLKHVRRPTCRPTIIDQTQDLLDLHSEGQKSLKQRKRRRIVESDTESESDLIQAVVDHQESDSESERPLKRLRKASSLSDRKNKGIEATQSAKDLIEAIRKNGVSRRPVEYDEMDTDVDERGNIAGLIDYSDSESDWNDEGEHRKGGSSDYEKQYQVYYRTLDQDQQKQLSAIEKELVAYLAGNDQPIKYRILMMEAPIKMKSVALSKLKNLSQLEKTSPDYAYEWTSLNYLLDLPWNRYIDLPVSKQSGLDKIQSYLKDAMDFLETVTYGQYRAKSTLLLKLARYLENPESSGFILGIKGPPGSGKTTLVNNGLSKLLNRPFFRIDLGGAKHADSLLGTRKVFERSDLGDLTRFLIEGKCMNPVFFFDELDKVSTTDYGRELIDTLNDLTDKTRNKTIVDQYLGLPLDFSKAIYVFAYNSSDQIPESLMSRIHEIEIEPYTVTDKIEMCSKFFLPKACMNLNFDQKLVSFEPSALKWLIAQQKPPELGARELERSIENIIEKLCWSRLTMGHELNDYHCDGLDTLTFPAKINLKLMKSLHSTFSLC